MDGSFFYIKNMKITRQQFDYNDEWEIDFSRELKFYDIDEFCGNTDPRCSTTEYGVGVPVFPTPDSRDEIYFWDSCSDIVVTVGDDRYMLDKDNPKEYARLVNNLETLFALHGL